MNQETREKTEALYNAITNLPDDRIEEALPPQKGPKEGTSRKALLPLAACLAAVALFGAWDHGLLGHTGGAGGGGGEAGQVYMSYAGPVFPLSAVGEPDLTAERSVTFDFSPYGPYTETWETPEGQTEQYTTWNSQAIVTDSCTLTNQTDTDQTVTLLYPFAADLLSGQDLRPTVTVDGQAVETTLHIGPTAEGFSDLFGSVPKAANQAWNLIDLMGWTSYQTILEAGYLDRTMAPVPALDQPVTVYRLKDCAPPEGYTGESYTLAVEYRGTVPMLTYGFNSGRNDVETDTHVRGCSLSADGWTWSEVDPCLIVLSGDLGDYTVKAYAGGGMETPLEGATWTLDREETTLAAVLSPVVGDLLAHNWRSEDGDYLVNALSVEEYTHLVAGTLYETGALTGDPAQAYGAGMLEELFTAASAADRVCYLSFDVTLPAHGTAEVSASMVKPASFDFTGKDRDRNGYDLVTRLGSPLTFTAQTASVTNLDRVEIIGQNFGFDPEAGITTVTLDPAQPHYWLEVVRRT